MKLVVSRSEGLGVRATGRVYHKSHATILRWEARLARQGEAWSPPATEGSEITLEGDELYTRVGENLPPSESSGWTLTFLERESRYWVTAQARRKEELLFTQGIQDTWAWAQEASPIRWFTDGERRYGKALWPLASERLSNQGLAATYPFRKVWREGLEVAIKIKGSQGQQRAVWLKVDHPFTALSPASEVHANHNVGVRLPEGWRTIRPFGDGVVPIAAAKTSMLRRPRTYNAVWTFNG